MPENLDRVLERLRQSLMAIRDDSRAAVKLAASAGRSTSGGFTPGSRVFDTISGEEGEVVGRSSENVVIPTTK